MLGYLIAEWREWEAKRLKISLGLFAAAGLVGLAYSYLQPLLAGCACVLASAIAGWLSANRFRPRQAQARLAAASRLGPAALLFSRCLASLAAFGLCLLVFSPALAIIAAAWDLGASEILAALCLWLGAFLLAMSAALLAGRAFGRAEQPLGIYAFALWTLVTALVSPARIANPFLAAWRIFVRMEAAAGFACALAELVAAGLLLALSTRSLGRAAEAGA